MAQTAEGAVVGGPTRRHVAAAVVGNWLEFYDFTVYAYFALQIGAAFFPNHSPFVSLLLSLVTFGAGFDARKLLRLTPSAFEIITAGCVKVVKPPGAIIAELSAI